MWDQFHSHDELRQYITADVMNKRTEIFIILRIFSTLLHAERQIDHPISSSSVRVRGQSTPRYNFTYGSN
jgi:DNA repair protein RadC